MTTAKPKLRWFQVSLRTLLVVVTLTFVLCSIATYIGWDFILTIVCSIIRSVGAYIIGWSVPLSIVLVLMVVGGVIAMTRGVEVPPQRAMLTGLIAPKPKLRWLKFLRTLLVLVPLCAIMFGWLAIKMQQAKSKRELEANRAVEIATKKLGGQVSRCSSPYIYSVNLNGTQLTDVGLAYLNGYSQLGVLWLEHTKITDAGLEHLKGLTQLRELRLGYTEITDTGLENLKGLTQLRELRLCYTKVTDLKNLKGLRELSELDLDGTRVTDAGLKDIKGFRWLIALRLNGTRVTDAGLAELKGMEMLAVLHLNGTRVTDVGLDHLSELWLLTILHLDGTQVTDAGLENLYRLNSLQELRLSGTKVTVEGVKKLQQALPKCKIIH